VTIPNSAPATLRDNLRLVAPADWACLFILTVVTVTLLVALLGGAPVGGWTLLHLLMLLGYAGLAWIMVRNKDAAWVRWVRALVVIHVMFGLYSTLGRVVFIAIPWNGDPALDAIDTWLFFGVSPALQAQRWVSYGSVEFFSFCYGLFIPYLYLSIVTGLLGRPGHERHRFVAGFAILYSLSFLGYLYVPAKGPIVHNAAEFSVALSGGTFHGIVLRSIEAAGGPHGAFPSLHVGAAAYACLFDLRYNRLRGATYLPLVVLIAMATVLLRYHYVIDWIAGLMFAVFAAWLSHAWTARREAASGSGP
jgi:hypothetical protein